MKFIILPKKKRYYKAPRGWFRIVTIAVLVVCVLVCSIILCRQCIQDPSQFNLAMLLFAEICAIGTIIQIVNGWFDKKRELVILSREKPTSLEYFSKEDQLTIAEEDKNKLYDLLSKALDNNQLYGLLIAQAIGKSSVVVNAAPGSIVATDGGTINITQHINQAIELQKAIASEPQDSKNFVKVAKKKALDIIGGAIEDIAKGEITKAAKLIVELGKDLGPVIAKTAAFAFFKGLL